MAADETYFRRTFNVPTAVDADTLANGRARFESKREAGISTTRRDGSERSVVTDENAAAAERFAADLFGVKYNDAVYNTHGDGGCDFSVNLEVEVVWLGLEPDGTPRESGHLIVNPNEPWRWAHLYVVVAGNLDRGFRAVGFATHAELVRYPLKDFGFGKKYNMPVERLHKLKFAMPKKTRRPADPR